MNPNAATIEQLNRIVADTFDFFGFFGPLHFMASQKNLASSLLIVIGCVFAALDQSAAQTRSEERREIDFSTLRVGMVIGENVNYSFSKLEPFRQYLAQETGRPVHIAAARDYRSLSLAHQKGDVHYAIYSAAAYVEAWGKCRCMEPVAVPKALSGGTGIYSVLLVADGSPYRKLTDLDQRRVLYVGAGTVAGHLMPARAMTLESGRQNFVFEDADISTDARTALGALMLGTASGVFGWEGAEGRNRGTVALAERGNYLDRDFARVLWRSELMPHGPHAVLTNAPQDLKNDIQGALLKLNPADPSIILQFSDAEAVGQTGSSKGYSAADILDSFDLTFGGGFAIVDHYDYLPLLNLLGWGSEDVIPAWP